jgi:hypothetical protein
MYNYDIISDPHLPKSLKQYPSLDREADIWVMETIRKLRPAWWARLSQGYDEAFYHQGVYKPHQELNARKRMANAWLLDKYIRFASH